MNNAKSFNSSRLVLLLGTAAILVVGSLLVATSGAHAATAAPVISAISSGTPANTTANITWTTDEPSDTRVFYGTTAGGENAYSTLADSATGVTSHTSNLGGLLPNTTYFYEVVSQTGGLTSTSTEQSFMTANTAAGITASSTAPAITSIVATPTDTGATITWSTNDQLSNSQVVYGATNAYGNMTTLADTGGINAHSVAIAGLTPGTTYHFAVISGNGQTTSTSTDQTFVTTGSAPVTAAPAPVLSAVMVSPTDTGATITWSTDIAASSQVLYGTSQSYGSMSPLDSTQVTSHSVTLTGLTPATLYDFQVWSTGSANNTASSTNFTFMTAGSSGTGTGSTTTDMLQAEITALQARVSALEAFIAGLGGGTGSTTLPTGGTGMIDQNGMTVTAGGTVDFSGRNFGHEENVTVMLNGTTVATAHADGGGNFSTGSIPGPTTAGTYTYQFKGQNSGITGSASVTAQ